MWDNFWMAYILCKFVLGMDYKVSHKYIKYKIYPIPIQWDCIRY